MCKVLMPIKPQYAMKILSGEKTFEYRKNKFKRENVDSIIIYVTSPVMKVLGEVQLIDVLEDSPINIWDITFKRGGIDKINYERYYSGKSKAFAYVLGEVKAYKKAKTLKDYGINYYPQSYVYLE